MNTKKYIIGLGISVAALTGFSSLALADMTIQAPTQTIMLPKPAGAMEMVLQVGPMGKVLLRGTIDSVSTNSLTVKSWGGDWTVNVSASTEVMPDNGSKDAVSDLAQFKVGDFVGVQGSINAGASWTIDATLVRDWNLKTMMQENKTTMMTERHNTKQEIKDVIKNESPKNWQGTVSNINTDSKSFTLTVDGTAYTVQLVTGATVVNKVFLGTDLAKVKDGDTVRVWGPVTQTTINGYIFRDVSLRGNL